MERDRGANRAERACLFTIRSPAVCPVAGTCGDSSSAGLRGNREFAVVTRASAGGNSGRGLAAPLLGLIPRRINPQRASTTRSPIGPNFAGSAVCLRSFTRN
jgi:hypothetical protein